MKRKKTKYDPTKEAKRRARDWNGPIPGQRLIPDKRRKKPKHKVPSE